MKLLLEAIDLDPVLPRPLFRQLHDALKDLILSETLAPGTRLPSTRTLAQTFGVSRNTVVAAFDQLAAEGYITTRVGDRATVAVPTKHGATFNGTLLRPDQTTGVRVLSCRGRQLVQETQVAALSALSGPFVPNMPDVTAFPRGVWSRLLARRARQFDKVLIGGIEPGGYGPLRELLAVHLKLARSVHCEGSQIVILSSARAGTELTARLLCDRGDMVWLEEPGCFRACAALLGAGLGLTPVAVDAEGIVVEEGVRAAPRAKLAYVTAAHQCPTGAVLSARRRVELLNWARETDAWILDEDHDGQFQHVNRPLSADWGLNTGGRVLYLTSFTRCLLPSFKVAYLVVPKQLASCFTEAIRRTGQGPPLFLQAALHDFIEEGHLAIHIKHTRKLYGQRRAALIESIERHLGDRATLLPSEGGLHLALRLPDCVDAAAVAARVGTRGIVTYPLSAFCMTEKPLNGLLLGFAATPLEAIDPAVNLLAECLPNCLS